MHLFQPPQPGWAFFITSLLVIEACFVREKAHSNRRKDTKDMSSVFVGCKFGRCYFDINSVLLLIVRMHQMLRRVENKRVRCTVSKSDALACHSRCRLPGTGWSSQISFELRKKKSIQDMVYKHISIVTID